MGFFIFLLIVCGCAFAAYDLSKKREREEFFEELERKKNEEREALENAKRLVLLMEVKRQAELVGQQDVVDAVMSGTYEGELPEQLRNGTPVSMFDGLEVMSIAGINYRGNLKAYVGDFKGVLIPEPKNDYDPNAIMVKCEDGKHLGYVPEDLTYNVRDAIGEDFQRWKITGHIDEREDEYELDESGKARKYFSGYIYFAHNQKQT